GLVFHFWGISGLSLSAFAPYVLWIHTEIFTAFLVAGFTYHYLTQPADGNRRHAIWMGVFLAGATALKPPLIILGLPAVLPILRKKQWRAPVIFLAALIILSTLTVVLTGDINPYGGNRKIFTQQFPLDTGFDAFVKGHAWSMESAGFHFNWNVLSWNILFFWIGRFSGLLWYFFPGVMAVTLALIHHRNRRVSALLTTIGFLILIQIVMIPANYHGGGGALGNRLFVSLYPVLIMSLPGIPRMRILVPATLLAALFSGPFLVTPWKSSYQPGNFTRSGFYRFLPVEWTLTGAFPIFDPGWYRAELPGLNGHAYFLDRYTTGKIDDGFSIFEGGRSRFILELDAPVPTLDLIVSSTDYPMEGTVKARSHPVNFSVSPEHSISLHLPLGPGHIRRDIFGITRWIYPVSCRIRRTEEKNDATGNVAGRGVAHFRIGTQAPEPKRSARPGDHPPMKNLLRMYNE
ncbi:MAG TPA: hypothetical protein PLV45_11075, partial [bacterium]|nr:hypothetical protein [bacterium]